MSTIKLIVKNVNENVKRGEVKIPMISLGTIEIAGGIAMLLVMTLYSSTLLT